MGYIKGIIESFFSQGEFGLVICIMIAIVYIVSGNKAKKIEKVYIKAIENFNNSDDIEDGEIIEKDFIDEELIEIVKKFKNSAKNGTEDINTEVIIQRAFENKVANESLIKGRGNVLIGLGLLGTFLGLVFAIGGLQGSLGEIQSMDTFKETINGPLESMGGAFWTSIAGVALSLRLNVLLDRMNKAKEKFYDLIEDYLDNIIYAKYAKNFNTIFNEMVETLKSNMCEFNNNVSVSMTNLAGDMRVLFKEGVEELVNKINKNTIDLTESMEGLKNYTKDLQRLTSSLDRSVNNFKNPIDNFKNSIEEFANTSEEMTKSIEKSMNIFSIKVETLDENLTKLYTSVDENKDAISEIGKTLKIESRKLEETYKNITSGIEGVIKNNSSSVEELKGQVVNLNGGYIMFSESLGGFIDSLRIVQNDISEGISNTLKNEMNALTGNIVNELGKSMDDITEVTKQLTRNSIDIGELIKQTNNFYVRTIKEKPEVMANEI